jgi:hypothetical protein
MKILFPIIFTLLSISQSFGQNDKNGNPVFNSISTGEKKLKKCLLISNYYTLNNNIENKLSSVFISERPTLEEIEKAATDLASDFFILTKKNNIVAMIMLQEQPQRKFMTIIMNSNKRNFYSCNLKGDITENRAIEILNEKYDSTATIEKGILFFNKKEFKIISNKEIEKAILEIIEKNKLHKKKPSEIFVPSQSQLKKIIIKETKKGGKVDFFTKIKGHEYDGVQVKPGVFSTKLGIALYQWGKACFDIGINTVEDAYEIFAEIKGRELNKREKIYIKLGFYKELEK